MVITKTPFRVSFFGGGTDYPSWAEENGGMVLSTTINKYCYITCRYLPPFFPHNYQIRYTVQEHTKTIEEIKHPSVRECLKFMKMRGGIEMQHNSDLPAMSGLGSSSAFTVGFLHGLYGLQGKLVSKQQLAKDAIHVEQNLIKENVGSQDQVAVAHGGLNKIEFGGPEKVRVTPLAITAEKLEALQGRLMLFFTGFSRDASDIAAEQIKNTKNKEKELRAMAALVPEAMKVLSASEDLKDFGKLLDESWQLKKGLSSKITNPHIDEMYRTACEAGAIGGKLLGAGGGGFMLLFAEPEIQPAIRKKLGEFLHVPFQFERAGSQIIHFDPTDSYGAPIRLE
ncbi:MAG: kinase [Candidatus Liptonbacteria bacterium]|nr:kinase [Candidatus Liptonbacteria bacterium]